MPRQLLAVPFGAGLDRASGQLAADPSTFADLRNVVLADGRARVRQGMTRAAGGSLAGYAEALALAPYRAEGRGVVVLYDPAARAVSVARCSSTGTAVADVGAWFTANAARGRPRAVVAESYGVAFLAHDEADVGLRAPTRCYDPRLAAPDDFAELPLTLDGGARAPVKFRGVARFLAYVFGWGYGTAGAPESPHTLRFSDAGAPRSFAPESYFQVGAPGDPIITVAEAGGRLLVFKAGETYALTGYAPDSFGITPADPQFGCVGARLAVTVGARCYFWSAEGPRVSDGGASADLALALDLTTAEPASLPPAGDVADGWAAYDPAARSVLFGFPSSASTTTRVYCCSLGDGGSAPVWSYHTFARALRAAAVLVPGDGSIAPPGVPAIGVPVVAAGSLGRYDVTIPWTDGATLGDELVEVWTRQTTAAGVDAPTAWAAATTTTAGTAGTARSVVVRDLLADRGFAVALRYTRGSRTSAGSESADPATWPAGQRATFATPADAAPPGDDDGAAFVYGGGTIAGGRVVHALAWGEGGAWSLLESSAPSAAALPGSDPVVVAFGASGTGTTRSYPLVSGGAASHYRLWLQLAAGPFAGTLQRLPVDVRDDGLLTEEG